MIHKPASHVIVSRATGKAIQEVFGPRPTLSPALTKAYEIVPILEWLQRLNERSPT